MSSIHWTCSTNCNATVSGTAYFAKTFSRKMRISTSTRCASISMLNWPIPLATFSIVSYPRPLTHRKCIPRGRRIPFPSVLLSSLSNAVSSPSRVTAAYDVYEFYHGIIAIMDVLRACNAYVQHEQPWLLAKSSTESDRQRLHTLIYVTLECLRVSGILLQPIIPSIARQLLDILAIDRTQRALPDCASRTRSSAQTLNIIKNERVSLYQRLPMTDNDL